MAKRWRWPGTIGTISAVPGDALPGLAGTPAEGCCQTQLEIRAEIVHFMEQAPNAAKQPGPGIPQRTDGGGRAPF